MKPIYIKLVFDRKKKSTATTPGAVEERLTQDKRALYFATGVRLLPRQWHMTGRWSAVSMPLTFSSSEILERYGRKLPIISNVKYNEYLKALALMADINKPISSHWARHTKIADFLSAAFCPLVRFDVGKLNKSLQINKEFARILMLLCCRTYFYIVPPFALYSLIVLWMSNNSFLDSVLTL